MSRRTQASMPTQPAGTDTGDAGRLVAGRYQLVEALGRGGSSTVWRAEDTVLGRVVAVKEVRIPALVDPAVREELRTRTLREARAAARLDHPAAVRVYDVVEDAAADPRGRPCLVMELLGGRTLAETVADQGPLPPAEVAEIGRQVLGALRAAHAVGMLHRDVKPGNVQLRGDGTAVLTDFGIAVTTDDPSLTATGLLLGSPAYIAPERVAGEPGPAADLYGLGATLYTAAEGRPPHEERGDPLATLSAVLQEEPAPCVLAGPLAPLLQGLLAKNPADRPDAATVDRGLAAITGTGSRRLGPERAPDAPGSGTAELAVATRPSGSPPLRPGAASRRRRAAVAGALAAALVLGVALGALGSVTVGDEPSAPPLAVARPEPPASVLPSPAVRRLVPRDWVRYLAPTGWSIAHPPGWTLRITADRSGGVLTYFDDPDTGGHLLVDITEQPAGDPVQHWQQVADDFAARYPSYEQARITPVTAPGAEAAADWEFTYVRGGVLLHVLDRALTTPSGSYAVLVEGPADRWAELAAVFRTAVASLRPAPAASA